MEFLNQVEINRKEAMANFHLAACPTRGEARGDDSEVSTWQPPLHTILSNPASREYETMLTFLMSLGSLSPVSFQRSHAVPSWYCRDGSSQSTTFILGPQFSCLLAVELLLTVLASGSLDCSSGASQPPGSLQG
jgi:hypothetical protein